MKLYCGEEHEGIEIGILAYIFYKLRKASIYDHLIIEIATSG